MEKGGGEMNMELINGVLSVFCMLVAAAFAGFGKFTQGTYFVSLAIYFQVLL